MGGHTPNTVLYESLSADAIMFIYEASQRLHIDFDCHRRKLEDNCSLGNIYSLVSPGLRLWQCVVTMAQDSVCGRRSKHQNTTSSISHCGFLAS